MNHNTSRQTANLGWMALCLVAIMAASAMAQVAPDATGTANAAKPPKPPKATSSASGIVLAVINANSFSIVDNSGVASTVVTNADTTYGGKKAVAAATTFRDVVVPGMKIKAALGPDGTATQVTASGMSTQLSIDQLKPFMHCSEAEWAVIAPMIQKVQNLQSIAEGNGPITVKNKNNAAPGAAAVPPAPAAIDPLAEPQKLLAESAYDQNSFPDQIVDRLDAYRTARLKAQEALTKARKDLAGVLTPQQEALLVSQGILD